MMYDECTWDGGKDVDAVLTTREAERMFKAFFIKPEELDEDEFDNPLGEGTGAGVIFGATGGVMEAALRSAYYLVTGNNPDADAFQSVRGLEGWKEASFDLNGTIVNVAVASGLGNTRHLMNAIKKGEVHYDFVAEIMSCPGGCINGGGQPYKEDAVMVEERRRPTVMGLISTIILDSHMRIHRLSSAMRSILGNRCHTGLMRYCMCRV